MQVSCSRLLKAQLKFSKTDNRVYRPDRYANYWGNICDAALMAGMKGVAVLFQLICLKYGKRDIYACMTFISDPNEADKISFIMIVKFGEHRKAYIF